MNSIQLIENRQFGAKVKAIVTNKSLIELERLQFAGGFKRFEIDIYEYNIKGKSSPDKIKEFLTAIKL